MTEATQQQQQHLRSQEENNDGLDQASDSGAGQGRWIKETEGKIAKTQ